MTFYDPSDLTPWLQGVFEREAFWNSKDEGQHPWVFVCPKPPCNFAVGAKDEESAKAKAARHAESDCPRIGPRHFGASITVNLIETAWEMADAEYGKLIADGDGELTGDKLQQQRGILAGMARILVVFMRPLLSNQQEIADELRRRRNARDNGTAYTTPGLGTRIFVPPVPVETDEDKLQRRINNVLDEANQTAVAMALRQGIFAPAQLAKMYNCTEEVIRAVGELTKSQG